jgi:transcriptional regulator with XRE-family HTH domain
VKYLRHIREKKGLSQDKLADLAGVPQNTISRIERGERKPHRATLEKLAKVLNVEQPRMLALSISPNSTTFEELIEGTPEERRAYFEHQQETGRLDSFIENLLEIYKASIEDYRDDPMVVARIQSAHLLGYTRAIEDRKESTDKETKENQQEKSPHGGGPNNTLKGL